MLKFAQKLAAQEQAESLVLLPPADDWRTIRSRPCQFDVATARGFIAECRVRGIELSLTSANQIVVASNGRSNQAIHDAMDDPSLMSEVKRLLAARSFKAKGTSR